ncbi:MAG: phospho-sugar mutase [Polyangiaceae bacterium]|jgi:phosphomannomutase
MTSNPLRERAERWLADDFDESTRAELRILLDHAEARPDELADRFAGDLAFGTAGLRGELGAGPNRMNRAVAVRATFGLAEVLGAEVPDARERGIVIGGDARRWSREMVEDVAAVLGASGFQVLLFAEPVPTPVVAFAVRIRRAAAGVVLTASHNPATYNGYKVYWENGAPILPPVDAQIASAMARAPAARTLPRPARSELLASGLLTVAGAEMAEAYFAAVAGLGLHPGAGDRQFRIVYTPMHGVGDRWARRALADAGFTDVVSVPEQCEPDASFPTVVFPNPEEPGALDFALERARRVRAALVLANDPDADRLAVAVRSGDDYRRLSGNEVGLLLGHYWMTESPRDRPLAVVTTVTSSPIFARMAAALGVRCDETLTGFKWLAHHSRELEAAGYRCLLAFEEAIGYAVGDVVYDKDGISAAVAVAELVAVLAERGRTVFDELDRIGRRFGVSASSLVAITRKGAVGAAAVRSMMERLRAAPPEAVAGDSVASVADYLAGVRFKPNIGVVERLALPASNVLSFELASGSRVVVRPSGTEPKVKIYFDALGSREGDVSVGRARDNVGVFLKRLVTAFLALPVVAALGPRDE